VGYVEQLVRVHGVEQLAALQKALEDAPIKLRRHVTKGLAATAEPLIEEAKKRAEEYMPSGFGPDLAASLVIKANVTGGTNPRATLRARALSGAGAAFKAARAADRRRTRARQRRHERKTRRTAPI